MADEDRCEVCDDPTSRTTNQILYCDGVFKDGTKCDMPVHQACYNVQEIPDNDWFCDRCLSIRQNRPVDVICCPMKTGAVKRTQHPGKFMHVVCAAYHKDVQHNRFPYYYINKDIDTQQCYKCLKRQGLCLKCSVPDCQKYFHATCGVHAGIIHVGYPMPIGDPIKCNDHQTTPPIPSSSSLSSSSSSSSTVPFLKRPSPSLVESQKKIPKLSNENTNDSNLFIKSRSNSISGSSSSNGQRRPSLAIKSKSKQQLQQSSFSNTNIALANIPNRAVSPPPSVPPSTTSSSTSTSNDEVQKLKKEVAQLKAKIDSSKKEASYKDSETSYLKARLEDAKKDAKKAYEKVAEFKALEKQLGDSNNKLERMHRDLQSMKDFKKNVSDIFMSLNVRLSNNTAPSPTKMDEYVQLLRDTLTRASPSENEWLEITNFANKLAMKNTK